MRIVSELLEEQRRKVSGDRNKTIWETIIYNVQVYGAKGDGSDDSSAVAEAIADANGSAVFFPAGVYDLTNMTALSGRVNLLSFGDVTIKGFKYTDITMPQQGYSFDTDFTDSFFQADGITFEGVGTTPGLHLINQSQGGVIRSFDLSNCTFRGPIGLVTENCLTSTIANCNFIHNQYGWKSLSCTNLVVTDSQFISPIIGVLIDASSSDTSSRKGGENIKFQGCTWIDGVTGIQSINHNYLWLSSCLLDYFNCGLYLKGSKFARFENIYIGYNDSDRSGRSDYIAPIQFGALYGCGDQASSRSTGVEAINCEFVAYNVSTKTPVILDGSTVTFTGIEEVDFSACRFASDNASNTNPYLLQIIKANEVLHFGSKYYSPSNNNLTAPWVFTTIVGDRIFSERNNYKNCFNSVGTTISPASGKAGNEIYESATITLAVNGTATTNANNYTYKNIYVNTPKVIATVKSGPVGFPSEKLNVGIDAQDTLTVFLKASHIDGTVMASGNVEVNIIVIGD